MYNDNSLPQSYVYVMIKMRSSLTGRHIIIIYRVSQKSGATTFEDTLSIFTSSKRLNLIFWHILVPFHSEHIR